jgi:hypothetical protein
MKPLQYAAPLIAVLLCISFGIYLFASPLLSERAFKRPTERTFIWDERRHAPHLHWVKLEWLPEADAPFQAVRDELAETRIYRGFDTSGRLRRKALRAYGAWRRDWKDPEKFYAACAYYLAAVGLDQKFREEELTKEVWTDLNLAWEIFPNPPSSYQFVRMGYLFKAGDGHAHIFGDLPNRLLERNPVDRGVLYAAVSELWDESLMNRNQPGKGEEFEELLLQHALRFMESPYAHPWDAHLLARIYRQRALRTHSRAELARAVRHNEEAIQRSPPEFDQTFLLRYRKWLGSDEQYMKHD